ncbi:hypothetical protein IVA98_27010 [Bradyrhizobium sp. 160]|uniref:hypothetical protein n=1 Tax=Bradyrhizobium sp. 160 TaxID=2782634 RepID=UPI001FF85568|nr:hypothetical protein [Bradyrhizobium sp. 160]MCK1626740.1 hypothetical protein [Bradyrhizobium sp. 160]
MDAPDCNAVRSSGVTDKVHHITTIARVAADLDQDDNWLRDVANKMAIEDGFIWVYRVGEDEM